MELLVDALSQWNIDIDNERLIKFEKYYELLISWNQKFNLTTVTQKEDVIIKHFVDSLAALRSNDFSKKKIVDVGTGAGFPGIPIKIMCPDCDIVLLDSLNKRVGFLNEVISELNLSGIYAIHSRAEDLAHDKNYRESFHVALSRAVANLSTLSEYCLPFVNIDGLFISYKSGNIDDELSNSKKAIQTLGGSVEKVDKFILPCSDNERSIVMINKIKKTGKQFPRKAGTPLKKPI